MKIKEHNMCRLCGEGQETPLHLLNECPATLSQRVAWETLLQNPDHAKCSPILSMAERLLFFAKEPKIKQLMTRDNEQAVLMLAHPRRHPNEAGSPQNPGHKPGEMTWSCNIHSFRILISMGELALECHIRHYM